ncbi:MAG: hypothetical protein AVDCRST_MAG79-2786 [uncultured Thermoleophilia bacterium]|uniref:Uncharacterized protein n=1 Tax=uncultured Thermoleophilia bacterium TaxID=1497501 RepID=A0A6J4UL74_9ACTN|nr:MAG: hypothetical protein AVDCRST_MAG79-2786 [uncultured Thermoleophilia bacterium]
MNVVPALLPGAAERRRDSSCSPGNRVGGGRDLVRCGCSRSASAPADGSVEE